MKTIQSLSLITVLFLFSACYVNVDETSTLTVKNGGDDAVIEIYIDQDFEDADAWGEDRLESDVIQPGESKSFQFPAGSYDIKIVTENEYHLYDNVAFVGEQERCVMLDAASARFAE